MSSSNRPAGPARPQNEQRDAVAEREGLDDLAAQQLPVDDGEEADTDEFAVADAIGDDPPGSDDDAGSAPQPAPGAGREPHPAERNAQGEDDSSTQRSRG